jgi:hypothetical protein
VLLLLQSKPFARDQPGKAAILPTFTQQAGEFASGEDQ